MIAVGTTIGLFILAAILLVIAFLALLMAYEEDKSFGAIVGMAVAVVFAIAGIACVVGALT